MERKDFLIENGIATWQMPVTQGLAGETYSGFFKFRCYLTPTQTLQIGKDYRELLGPMSENATQIEKNLAYNLAYCKQHITQAPPFWTSTLQNSGYAGDVKELDIIIIVTQAIHSSTKFFEEDMEKEKNELLDKAIKSAENKLNQEQGDQ